MFMFTNLDLKKVRKNDLKIFFSIFIIASLGFALNFFQLSWAEDSSVPSWIKMTAVWWGEEKIDDQEFINALQYLVDKKVVIIPEPENISESACGPGTVFDEISEDCVIPDESETTGVFPDAVLAHQNVVTSWIKVTALWWGQGKISNQDFVDALKYLAENRILTLPGPPIDPAFQKLPEPKNPIDDFPTYTSSWTLVDRMEDFQVLGHSNAENYLLRFKLVSVDQRDISSDGTISISIFDEYNRILYLDAFSVKKNDFSRHREQFTHDEDLIYLWEIPTSDVKMGFGTLGTAKIVFTDRGGNSFSEEFDSIPIPKFS